MSVHYLDPPEKASTWQSDIAEARRRAAAHVDRARPEHEDDRGPTGAVVGLAIMFAFGVVVGSVAGAFYGPLVIRVVREWLR